MRLLLFSDLHCDTAAARRLVEMSAKADLLVGAGDFGNLRRNVSACIDILQESHLPAVFVAGNNESTDELREACRNWPNAHVLHGTGVTLGGIPFFGVGGGIPVTPFGDWSYDFTEDQAAALLTDCPPRAILITHSPPKGLLDLSAQNKNLGSTAIRSVIQLEEPQLVVCGHIHASSGQAVQVGATEVINAGPGGMTRRVQGTTGP